MITRSHIRDASVGIFILLFSLFIGIPVSFFAQEAESSMVKFRVNNIIDREAPRISILSPVLEQSGRYITEDEKVEVIGEVIDQSKIRFVSVNNNIQMVNETGLFASTVKLMPGENEIRVKSMDENGYMQELVFLIDFTPPVITLADRINLSSTYYGLIIGIDEYKDPRIPDLENPIRDAKSLRKVLMDNYTFDSENITLLKNPGRSDIIRAMDALRDKVTPQDNLLIFFAGHGYWDEDADIGYWLPSDATRETTAEWFRNGALVDYLQSIRSRHTLLITDACFAGSIFKSRAVNMESEIMYDRIYEKPSRKAMTSGAMTEVPDNSVFVKYLVKRLDENESTYLASEELFYSFKMAVISNSNNVLPQYGEILNAGNEGGDFIFLKRKHIEE